MTIKKNKKKNKADQQTMRATKEKQREFIFHVNQNAFFFV